LRKACGCPNFHHNKLVIADESFGTDWQRGEFCGSLVQGVVAPSRRRRLVLRRRLLPLPLLLLIILVGVRDEGALLICPGLRALETLALLRLGTVGQAPHILRLPNQHAASVYGTVSDLWQTDKVRYCRCWLGCCALGRR